MQIFLFYRFGDIFVHSCGKAAISITFHCMRRHRDDWDSTVRTLLQLTDALSRLQPIHFRHLNIHQDGIVVTILKGLTASTPFSTTST